jgi:hypothetical protein
MEEETPQEPGERRASESHMWNLRSDPERSMSD